MSIGCPRCEDAEQDVREAWDTLRRAQADAFTLGLVLGVGLVLIMDLMITWLG